MILHLDYFAHELLKVPNFLQEAQVRGYSGECKGKELNRLFKQCSGPIWDGSMHDTGTDKCNCVSPCQECNLIYFKVQVQAFLEGVTTE